MKRIPFLMILILLICGTAAAEGSNLQVGAGAYVIAFDYDTDAIKDFNYQGYAITGTLALGPSSAVRGDLYFTQHEDHEELKLEGFDAQFLLGSNLNRVGTKLYLLGGYWSESFETDTAAKSDSSTDFSGLMAGVGIGYNWKSAALDFWVAWRDAGDYVDDEASKSEEVKLTAGSGAITFGLRF